MDLDRVDLTVRAGEIVGLIGPNGSGKTTLFNVITGIYRAQDGTVTFAGADVTGARPQAIYHAGITRTFQRSRMCLPLSVFDNIMVGNHKRLNHGLVFNLLRRSAFAAELAARFEEARGLLRIFSPPLADRMEVPVAGLPMIDRRRIEICRALISQPRLILLDEPSAGMTHEETRALMDDILLVRERMTGLTIVIIEHEMGVIERITDNCVVLNYGRKISEGRVRGGRKRPRRAGSLSRSGMMAGLEIDNVRAGYDKADVLDGVSLAVAPGRITCLLGSNGSGKTTLIRSILGSTRRAPAASRSPAPTLPGLPTHKIIAAGIACIPEGRKVFPKLTVEENLRLGAYQEPSAAITRERVAEIYAIFPRLAERRTQLAGTMSGGEQAMVSIGRGLMRAPKLLLLDEPSLGLSPILVEENFDIIRQINARGITVFLVEQNVHQTLAIAHYGYVLAKGRVVAAGTPAELADRPEVREAYFG